MTMAIAPYALTREEGRSIWFLGTLMTLKDDPKSGFSSN